MKDCKESQRWRGLGCQVGLAAHEKTPHPGGPCKSKLSLSTVVTTQHLETSLKGIIALTKRSEDDKLAYN